MNEQPVVNDLNAPFWVGARAGKLRLPHCAATGRAFWPPSPVSPYAPDAGIEWRAAPAMGVVRALATYRRVFLKAFEPLAPFAIALVELENGARMHAHVSDPGTVSAGDRVQLRFRVLIEGGPVALTAERTS